MTGLKMNRILDYFNELLGDAKCELVYSNDYELLIAILLSAQTTDIKVNKVTKILFSKYNLSTLETALNSDLESILKPLGMSKIKTKYIKDLAYKINHEYNGKVPDSKEELIKLSGVGNKTANVFLATYYKYPYFGVDTHVLRVCNRLNIVNTKDAKKVESTIYKLVDKDIPLLHHQFVLFGRYYCTSKKPKCDTCKLKDICNYYK